MPNRIFDLFAAVFKDAQPYITKPSHKKTAERYQLKKKTVLLKSVVPFFERFPLLFFRNAKRFQSFKLVLKALAKFPFKTVTCFSNKKDRTQLVLKKLYNCDIEIFDPSLRRRTLEEMLELLELDFKKFKII